MKPLVRVSKMALVIAAFFFAIGCNSKFAANPNSSSLASLSSPSPGPSPSPSPIPSPSPSPATHPPFGLNVDFNEQSLTNLIQGGSVFNAVGPALTSDAQGWPNQDFQYAYDNRYVFGWVSPTPPNVDPTHWAADLSGTYAMSFIGQATVAGFGGVIIGTPIYTSGTNTTNVPVTLPNVAGGGYFGINFTNTKKTAASAAGTGIANLQILRTSSNSIFTDAYLFQVKNFGWNAFRFMGATGTNSYGEAYPYLLNWATDRALPGVGPLYSVGHVGVHGAPWEYVIEVAHQTGRDLWINIPVNASDAYVTSLAQLFHNGNAATGNQGVSTATNIYVEYSNEMWHLGFPQGNWNKSAAIAEVGANTSNLNYDGINNQDMWRMRRIAKRSIEIGRIFKTVFTDRPSVIRPVINQAWQGFYPDMLNYVTANFGPPANDLYGIAQTGYYASADASSPAAILTGEMANSDANKSGYLQTRTIATFYGLHALVYEGGEGETGTVQAPTPADPTLTNKFAASRDPGMQQVLTHDLLTNWYPSGGELYMQFSQCGRYSVYGFWGLSEDVNNLSGGKWLGVKQVLASAPVSSQPGNALPATIGQSVSIPEITQPGTNWTIPSDQPWLEIPIQVSVNGTYSIQVQGRQTGAGNLTVLVDNQSIGTLTLGTTSIGGSDPMSGTVQVALTPGLHAIFVNGPAGQGPGGVATVPADATVIKRVQ